MDEEGHPVEGDVRMIAVDGVDPPWNELYDQLSKRVGEDGTFKLIHVPSGNHTLELRPRGFAGRTLAVQVGERSRDVDLGEIVFGSGLALQGRVVDGVGEPVSVALVFARRSESFIPLHMGSSQGAQTETEADGSFRISGLEQQTYQMRAFAQGFGQSEDKSVEAGSNDILLVIEPSGSVLGQVVDEDGAPFETFEVMLESRRASDGRSSGRLRSYTESEEGRFSMDGLPPNTYVVTVRAEGFKPTKMSKIDVWPGGLTELGRIVLLAGGVIRGTVLETSGEPIAGVTLTAHPGPREETVSDADGAFEIRGLDDGVVDVRASHPDYAEKTEADVEVRSNRGPVEIEIELSSGGRLEGIVRDRDGNGLPDRTISTQVSQPRYRETVTTDEAGEIRLERLPPGLHRVRLVSGGGEISITLQEREVLIREGETSVVEFVSRRVQVFGYARKADLPLAGAHIVFRPSQVSSGSRMLRGAFRSVDEPLPLNALTEQDGYYELWIDQPGDYEVSAVASDGMARLPSKSVVIPDEESHAVDLHFDSARVQGQVVSEHNRGPIARARVTAFSFETSRAVTSARTDGSGLFLLELEPGEYRLQIRAENHAPKEMTVPVRDAVSDLLDRAFRGAKHSRSRGRCARSSSGTVLRSSDGGRATYHGTSPFFPMGRHSSRRHLRAVGPGEPVL